VGTVLGLVLAGAVHHHAWHPDHGFAIPAGLAIVAALLIPKLVPVPPADLPAAAGSSATPAATAAPPLAHPRRTLAAFVLLLLAWTASLLGVNAVSALYPLLMQSEFDVSAGVSSFALAATTFLSLGLFLGASRLTAARGGLPVLQGALAVRVATLGLLAWLAVTPALAKPVPALFTHAGFTIVWPLLSISSTILFTRLGVATHGAGPGLANAAGALAGLAGPVIGGHVADRHGYESVWLLGAAGVAAALVLTLPLRGVAGAAAGAAAAVAPSREEAPAA
jgi:hypothetical protein